MTTQFRQLNDGWNAEPSAPAPTVRVDGADVVLEFYANPWEFPSYREGQRLRLRFANTSKYRLGAPNDEGWYRGQCRFSGIAPDWGEFYEVSGDLKMAQCSPDWKILNADDRARRHFLFYLRDETFECQADDWHLVEDLPTN